MASEEPDTKRRRIVDSTNFGPKPTELTAMETVRFVLRGFKDLPQEVGEFLVSDEVYANNQSWKLVVYPRGKKPTERVTVFLACSSSSEMNQVKAKFTFRVRSIVEKDEYTFSDKGVGRGWCAERG